MPLVNSRHAVARWLAAPVLLAFLAVPAGTTGRPGIPARPG